MSADRALMLGNPAAEPTFEDLFQRYYTLVYRLAFRCVGVHDEADDIAQEVFLRLYRLPPGTQSEAECRAWLCRVATNLSLNAVRTRQRRVHYEEQAGELQQDRFTTSDRSDPEQYVLAGERTLLTRSILAAMSEKQKTFLLLRSAGLSYAEIALATGVAPTSVGTLLARAEREFRRIFDERVNTRQAE